jgi:2-polyprenyl-3-methyl-5-hydroxy-6-metoxy-1,4-benzoquinol methylase
MSAVASSSIGDAHAPAARKPMKAKSEQDVYFDEVADELARKYETHRALGDAEAVFSREARIVLERFVDATPARCLDLGCGPGVMAVTIAERGFDVVGVDRSEKMIALAARRQLRSGSRGKVKFVRADAADFLASSPDTFSLVIASDVFQYLEDPLGIMGAVFPRLRPGGTLAFSIANQDSVFRRVGPWVQGLLPEGSRGMRFWQNRLRPARYLSAAPDLGFSLEKVRTFGLPEFPAALDFAFRNRMFQTMTLLVFRRL